MGNINKTKQNKAKLNIGSFSLNWLGSKLGLYHMKKCNLKRKSKKILKRNNKSENRFNESHWKKLRFYKKKNVLREVFKRNICYIEFSNYPSKHEIKFISDNPDMVVIY